MAGNIYVRSLMWLVCSGGLGYALLLITRPSEEKLARIRATTSRPENYENEKRYKLFSQKLQEAIGLNVPQETSGNDKKTGGK